MAKDDIDALRNLEAEAKNDGGPVDNNNSISDSNNSNNSPNHLDGYTQIETERIPQAGLLYPSSWRFARRPPVAKEVGNFSTINENDKPGIIKVTEDLIRKCIIIYDIDNEVEIPTSEINDAHRIFFMLLLRDEYLPGSPIEWDGLCSSCDEHSNIQLTADCLQYPELSEKLIDAFDGRIFTFIMPGIDVPIIFKIPTIGTSSKIFQHIIKIYKQQKNGNPLKKDEKIFLDKQFILFAPFLYKTGREEIKELRKIYLELQKDEKRYQGYLQIMSNLKLDNLENINYTCDKCDSLEENPIMFPGGWKKFFISTKNDSGYFD